MVFQVPGGRSSELKESETHAGSMSVSLATLLLMLPIDSVALVHALKKQDGQDGQDKFLYKDLSERVIGAAFEVIGELGAGFVETVYHHALIIALLDKGVSARSDVPIDVFFRRKSVGKFRADILVESKILVELKAVRAIAPEHQAQVINYLKATGIKVGLLINFGRSRLEIRRLYR
jgi:GxxExxY protein